jgi:hypothetical protein
MEKLMPIYDILQAGDGHAVVAGTSPHLNSLDLAEIKRLVGDSVIVVTKSDSRQERYDVLGVEISVSLIGNKNVFLKLGIPFEKAERLKGAEVLTITI